MYPQTLERAPPAEHPALVTGSREQYQESRAANEGYPNNVREDFAFMEKSA